MDKCVVDIVEKMQSDKCLALQEGEVRVVAVIGDNYVMHGDIVKHIQTSHSRETIIKLCAGAKHALGSCVFVIMRCDSKINIMHHTKFVKKFAVKAYESPIAL